MMQSDHTLYLCYFGLREPLVQTQVLPYLREIKKIDGLKVSLLTFEPDFKDKWNDADVAAEKEKLAAENIDWYALPYHKSPSVPATLYDIFSGAKLARKFIEEKNINILHARSHVPALMGAMAKKLSGRDMKLIFDIRGFFPEEYTDAGRWKENGWLYHSVKIVEKWLLKKSDAFVVLTEKAREILFPESKETGFDKQGRPVEVIPCCVDLAKFGIIDNNLREQMRTKLEIAEKRVITYVGSFGGWYLTEEIIDFLEMAKNQDESTFALILTQRETRIIADRLRKRGFSESDFLVISVLPSEIPKYLSTADIAISFIKKCYSKQASSPTKIAEYLASGLPIVYNSGVGDLDELIRTDEVGVLLDDFSKMSYLKSLQELDKMREAQNTSERCKLSAKQNFDLENVGGKKYRSFYQRLLDQKMKKILITGGAGFIGTHLRNKLIEEGHFVRIIDNLLPQVHGENPNIEFSGCEFIKADIQDMEAVSKAVQDIDIVFHLAAETGVGQSQYEIGRYVATNTLGTAVVLQASVKAKVKQFIVSSSRAVYGEGLHYCENCDKHFVPETRQATDLDSGKWDIFCSTCNQSAQGELMHENHPTMPISIYGITKLQQEELARQVGKTYGLPITILRFFNVYGPGQSLTNPYVGVLGTFFRQIISRKGIDIYEDGQMNRDFVFIGDIVKVLYASMSNEKVFNQTINVGTGKAVTLENIGREIFQILNMEPDMRFSEKFRLGDIHHAVADIENIKEKFGFVPQTLFAEGLNSFLTWALKNKRDFSNIDAVAEQQLANKNLLRSAK